MKAAHGSRSGGAAHLSPEAVRERHHDPLSHLRPAARMEVAAHRILVDVQHAEDLEHLRQDVVREARRGREADALRA